MRVRQDVKAFITLQVLPVPTSKTHLMMISSDLNNGVGLSDSLYASRRRKMLDVINALHLTGYVVTRVGDNNH